MNEDTYAYRLPWKLVSEAILTRRMQQVPNGRIAARRVFRLSRPDEKVCNWVPEIASPSNLSASYEILAKACFELNLTEEEVEEA